MANQGEVISLLKWVADRWPNARMPKETVAAWANDLANLPVDRLQKAVQLYYMEGHEWPPNAGQLAAYCMRNDGETWDQTWAKLLAHMTECGHSCPHDKIALFGAAGAAALATIGWNELCMTDTSNMTTMRAQFRDTYVAIQGRYRRELALELIQSSSPLQLGGSNGI